MDSYKKRIMVIDDEPSITRLLKLNLEQTGRYEVCSINNETMALAAAREFQPDLILLDVAMESQEICFIEDRNYLKFIDKLFPIMGTSGPIVNLNGKVIGTHKGVCGYTIGQRKGMGISAPSPLYVIKIDVEKNEITAGISASKLLHLVGLAASTSAARKLIEQNAIVALATDFNPASSHISSLSLIMSLAALKMKMTIEETISAVTINAAKALCREKTIGSIEIGKKVDFAVFNTSDYSDIVYSIGRNLNCMTIKNGIIIY